MLIHFNDLLSEKALICLVCLIAIAAMYSNYSLFYIIHLLRVCLMIVDQAEATVEHQAMGVRVVAWLLGPTSFQARITLWLFLLKDGNGRMVAGRKSGCQPYVRQPAKFELQRSLMYTIASLSIGLP